MPASDAGGRGEGAVYVEPWRQQLIGVRVGRVEVRPLRGTIRCPGILAYDETKIAQIHTKIAGWVDRLYVDYVGKAVARGEPLFSVYSPELVSTESELLSALSVRDRSANGSEMARAAANALVASARERLRRWDVTDPEIEGIERNRRVRRDMTLFSPVRGVVLERNTFQGQYVTPELVAFKVADLSTIWAVGEVFEYEVRRAGLEDQVEVELPYGGPAASLHGTITFVSPEVDPQTRRVKVRAVFENPDLELKPETFVTLVLRTKPQQRLAVPREALIDTGTRRYALLALPDGYFAPRDVEVGAPMGEWLPVTAGLTEGEEIVLSAQFLIDSETNLRAVMGAMSMSMPGMNMGAPAAPSGSVPRAPGSARPPPAPEAPHGMPGMEHPGGHPGPTP